MMYDSTINLHLMLSTVLMEFALLGVEYCVLTRNARRFSLTFGNLPVGSEMDVSVRIARTTEFVGIGGLEKGGRY